MLRVERLLLLGEELPDRRLTQSNLSYERVVRDPSERRRAHVPSRHRVHLDVEAVRAADLLGKVRGHDGPELDDRVAILPLPPARPDDDAGLVERELGRVEEED